MINKDTASLAVETCRNKDTSTLRLPKHKSLLTEHRLTVYGFLSVDELVMKIAKLSKKERNMLLRCKRLIWASRKTLELSVVVPNFSQLFDRFLQQMRGRTLTTTQMETLILPICDARKQAEFLINFAQMLRVTVNTRSSVPILGSLLLSY